MMCNIKCHKLIIDWTDKNNKSILYTYIPYLYVRTYLKVDATEAMSIYYC